MGWRQDKVALIYYHSIHSSFHKPLLNFSHLHRSEVSIELNPREGQWIWKIIPQTDLNLKGLFFPSHYI